MLPKGKKKSLAEEINNLMTVVPTYFDSDDDELTKARVVEREDSEISEDEYQASSIRRKTATLLADEDERYAGKKISRKAAFDNEWEEESNEELSDQNQSISDEEDEEEEEEYEESTSNSEDESNENSQSISNSTENLNEASDDNSLSSSDCENSEQSEFDDDNSSQDEMGIKLISNTNINTEVEKGKCVKNQLDRMEKLLKARILMQKCLAISNEMPQFNVYENFVSDPKTNELKTKTIFEISKLLDNLLELQNHFLKKNPEINNSKGNKREAEDEEITSDDSMNEEIPSDSENDEENNSKDSENDSDDDLKKPCKKRKLEDYEKLIHQNHKSFLQYRDSVIQKFDDKTRISSGKSNKVSQNQSVLRQIEFILNDREKLLKRTRLKRSDYNILGKESVCDADEDGRNVQEYDPEIFDDDDFYQQLLREVIESKTAENTDPVQLSRQWAQLQNMRNKVKRNIDTRATKGRRIRYVVHQKLVNFMAPITYNDTYAEGAKNELYKSLFGKSLNS